MESLWCCSSLHSCLLSQGEIISEVRWVRLDLGMFSSKGNMFLETERPEQKRTLCSRTHGQAAGCVVCEQRHPGRMMRDPCACPRSSRSLNRWGGSDITHCAVGQPWTLLGVFSSPCSYRRRHMEKRKWVKKRCIGEQGAFPRVSGPPTSYAWDMSVEYQLGSV